MGPSCKEGPAARRWMHGGVNARIDGAVVQAQGARLATDAPEVHLDQVTHLNEPEKEAP